MDDAAELFRMIYQRDLWNGGSGQGSATDATTEYRRVLQNVIASKPIRSVVDVGCGDWEFSRLVDWRSTRYTGIDVVPEVIAALVRDFGSSRIRFIVADARTARLPRADLLLCKDVLQHWPNQEILGFFERNARRFRYMLLTNDIWSIHNHAGVNADIPLGSWRPIDLEATPFELHCNWRVDFDIRGEWTKRILFVGRS